MPDDLEDLDPVTEASFLESQRAIARKISDRRSEEQLASFGSVGKKAIEVIGAVNALAADGDPNKAEIAAFIAATVKGAVMGSGRPAAEEARVAAQASPLSPSSPQSTSSLPNSTPKSLSHEPSEPRASPAPKKRGRPPKNSKA